MIKKIEVVTNTDNSTALLFIDENDKAITVTGERRWTATEHPSEENIIIIKREGGIESVSPHFVLDVKQFTQLGATTYANPANNTVDGILRALAGFFSTPPLTNTGSGGTTTTTTTATVKLWIYRFYKKVANVYYHGWEMTGETPTIYRLTLTTTVDSDGIATVAVTREVARKQFANYAETTGWTAA